MSLGLSAGAGAGAGAAGARLPRSFSPPSPAFAAVCQHQLEAVCLALESAGGSLRVSAYTRTPDSFASGRLRLSRCAAWPPPEEPQRLALCFEALLGDDDLTLLAQRHTVRLPGGALIFPLEGEGLVLGLLAAEAGRDGGAPPGAAASRALAAAARALSLSWALDQAAGAGAAAAGQLGAFVAAARQPLAAIGQLGGLLSRQLGEEGPPAELAAQLMHQSERLRELAAALESALYSPAPTQLGAAEEGWPFARARAALPPPAAAAPAAAAATDLTELLSALCAALAGVLVGRRLLAEGLDGAALLTPLPARDARAALAAALQAAAGATPAGAVLHVRAAAHARGARVRIALARGCARAASRDAGLRLAAAALERAGGALLLLAEAEGDEAEGMELHFPPCC